LEENFLTPPLGERGRGVSLGGGLGSDSDLRFFFGHFFPEILRVSERTFFNTIAAARMRAKKHEQRGWCPHVAFWPIVETRTVSEVAL